MTPKPIIHGFDHAKGGADPVPGIGDGLQYGGVNPVYGPHNTGEWLQVETTGSGGTVTTGVAAYTGLAIGIVDTNNNGIVIGQGGGGLINIGNGGGQIAITTLDGILRLQDKVGSTGAGDLYVNFGESMNFDGGYSTWTVNGFEVDSNNGIILNEDGGNTAGHDVTIHADHKVVITSGNDTNITASNTALLRAINGMTLLSDNAGFIIDARQTGTVASISARVESGCYFSVFDTDGSTELFRVTSGGSGNAGKIMMPSMGTVNPGVAGQLWNSGGTVRIA